MVILASRNGLNEYLNADARFNRNFACFPLIYDDEAAGDVSELLPEKRYFGYIGNLCRAHGFDEYLSFMRYALQRGLDVRFLIASRNPLPGYILRDSRLRRNLDKIEIRCGWPLQNDEMNRCYAESFCIWNLYRRSTQSAVLPKAFMFGTPVIASAIGSFPEYIQEGVNGRFADARNNESVRTALEDIRSNISSYSANCRRTFLETFFYRSRLPDLEGML
jgi:glycosyltransferase involved in cell wall biosynthesis